MRRPEKEIVLRVPGGLYRCGTPRFGAVIGDRCQTGNGIGLGPGVLIGRDCRIASGVTLAARTVPDHGVVTAPRTGDVRIRRRPVKHRESGGP
jgi:UDP-3-O-[3-hydroxymyristoyl] glucosamine N-acyltransferase